MKYLKVTILCNFLIALAVYGADLASSQHDTAVSPEQKNILPLIQRFAQVFILAQEPAVAADAVLFGGIPLLYPYDEYTEEKCAQINLKTAEFIRPALGINPAPDDTVFVQIYPLNNCWASYRKNTWQIRPIVVDDKEFYHDLLLRISWGKEFWQCRMLIVPVIMAKESNRIDLSEFIINNESIIKFLEIKYDPVRKRIQSGKQSAFIDFISKSKLLPQN